jgi:putative methylase
MRRSALVRALEQVPPPSHPRPDLEQVATPPERAADLLEATATEGGLVGRSVVDLGSGTGRLAIGAALLGARPVIGVEVDPALVRVAVESARRAGVEVEFREGGAGTPVGRSEFVVMNPPFGAQRAHADRPFWEAAFSIAERAIFAFALADSRTFIARRAVARSAQIVASRPVPWVLPRTFPHHARRRVPLDVDLWTLRIRSEDHDRPRTSGARTAR